MKEASVLKEFIVFDFETANHNRHSVYSVGFVFVKDGRVVDSIYSLINPEEPFDSFNTSIHGIQSKDVKDAPTFEEFYHSIQNKIEDQILIAHYMPFDGYALRDNIQRYNLQPSLNYLLCSYQLSKRLIDRQSSYSLKSLCQLYDISLDDHHHALADAKACAELMLKLIDIYQLVDLNSVFSKANIKFGSISPKGFRPSIVQSSSSSTFKLSEIEVSLDAKSSSPFYGKNIAFTGRLKGFSRREAAELLATKGGQPQNGITRNTNFIVVGDFENVMIKGNKSSKLKKAEELIQNGKELEILSEEDFLKMI